MDHHVNLPPEPQQPEDSQCCGQGCRSCVFDVYKQELLIWKKKCEELVTCRGEQETKMCPESYVNCVIEGVEHQCSTVFLFHFKLPEHNYLTFAASQHMIAREITGNVTISRPYTLISSPGLVTTFSVLIKLYKDGQMSKIIQEKWLPGYSVAWRGPIGVCEYKPNSYSNVLFIAAGTGITPMYQLAKLVIDNPDDETRIKLLYCCRNYSEILLRAQLREMQDYWNFKVRYFLSDNVSDSTALHNEDVNCHQLTYDIVHKEISSMKKNSLRVFLCGPKSFEKQLIDNLTKIGIEKSSIVTF